MDYRLTQLITICAILLALAPSNLALPYNSWPPIESQPQWIAFVPPDEEIKAMLPAAPTVRFYAIAHNRNDAKSEMVLAHGEYSGYGDGLIYIIQSFKAEHPANLPTSEVVNESEVFQRIQIADVAADLFRTIVPHRDGNYTRHTLRFLTAKHLYVISLMSLDNNSPAVDRFISEIKLRSNSEGNPIQPHVEISSGDVWDAKNVTRKAIVVWKSEPWYTEEARAHQTRGSVTLQAVFGEDGYVRDITVTKALEHGLTEAAIDAARNIRFFPADKDGRPVAQRIMLEYNFSLF